MGSKFFKRFYTWVDIVFYSFNSAISALVLAFEDNDQNK
jgi:hypothetical protein